MIAPTTTQERDRAERSDGFTYPAEERRAVLTDAECAAMGSLLHRQGASWRAARHQVLVPLFRPIHAALAFAGCRSISVSCSVRWQVLTDMEQRGTPFWVWSEDEWRETIGRTEALGRTYMTAVAYLLGDLDGLHALAVVDRATALAERVFGSAPVTATLGRVHVVVDGWGYDCKPTSIGYLNRVVCQALVVARSPHLEAVTRAHLDALLAINRGNGRTSVALLSRVLATLGILPVGIGRMRAADSRTADHGAEGMSAEWYGWCQRWRAQSSRRSTPTIYWHLLKTGRWLAAQFPAVTTPAQWTQEVAVACVAAVNGMKTGDWSLAWAAHNGERVGKPLRPNAKASQLSALRTFFRDCHEWGWVPVRFNPDRCLRTPQAVRNLIGPDPRVIDRPIWVKLVAAALALSADDLPTNYRYPLTMVQALAALWVCAGLRADEIVRLRVGCIRWQTEDVIVPETGALLEKETVCFLDVPVNKTTTAFTKPVPPIVGQRIAAWERERPAGQVPLLDATTGERVQFLFGVRNHRIPPAYLNAGLIPLLCLKAGVPQRDARGKITSHRARASIASMLYNGPEPWTLAELQVFLGHKNPQSTQYYAKVDPTRLAKKYADTGYLERNLAMVEVLLDVEALGRGEQRVLYYEMGHGLCSNPYWHQCPHRMACVRCPMYVPGEAAQYVRAQEGIRHLFETVPLSEEEREAAEGDEDALQQLIARNAGRVPPTSL